MQMLARPESHVESASQVSQQATPSVALNVSDVNFSYGQVQVLFGVSLEVHDGEALALLGTNGAGKSTLLRVIAGLEKPSLGTVSYFGDDITGVPAERLPARGLLLVVGGRAVFTDMTVHENLDMQAITAQMEKSRLKERREVVYEMFPALAARHRQRAGNLSGGEQQQLAVAKALLLEPKFALHRRDVARPFADCRWRASRGRAPHTCHGSHLGRGRTEPEHRCGDL